MKVGTGCQRGTRASARLAWTAALQAHAGEGNDDEVLGCQLGFAKKQATGWEKQVARRKDGPRSRSWAGAEEQTSRPKAKEGEGNSFLFSKQISKQLLNANSNQFEI